MNRITTTIGIVILAALALSACSTKNLKIGSESNGKTITINQGTSLILTIEGNPTTGYAWAVTDVDQKILSSMGEPGFKTDSKLVGSGGVYTFKFKAETPGTTTLALDYFRSFEPENPPLETFSVTVIVE